MNVELVHEALAVLFDRFNTEVQDLGAFLVRTAFGDELEYLYFAGGQDREGMGDATPPPGHARAGAGGRGVWRRWD